MFIIFALIVLLFFGLIAYVTQPESSNRDFETLEIIREQTEYISENQCKIVKAKKSMPNMYFITSIVCLVIGIIFLAIGQEVYETNNLLDSTYYVLVGGGCLFITLWNIWQHYFIKKPHVLIFGKKSLLMYGIDERDGEILNQMLEISYKQLDNITYFTDSQPCLSIMFKDVSEGLKIMVLNPFNSSFEELEKLFGEYAGCKIEMD